MSTLSVIYVINKRGPRKLAAGLRLHSVACLKMTRFMRVFVSSKQDIFSLSKTLSREFHIDLVLVLL